MPNLLFAALLLFALIGCTAFFVAAEYSLVASRRTRIKELAESGNGAAQTVLNVMADPDRFFAATQLGITATSLAIGRFGEPPISAFFEWIAGGALPNQEALSTAIGAAVGLSLATYLQVVLAELVPRSVTIRAAERVALLLVPIMNVLANVLRPFIWALKSSSQLVLRLFGLKPVSGEHERHHSVEELKMLVEASERGGVIESEQKDMLDAVFSFGDTTVREVMVPRTELVCLDVEATVQQAVHTFAAHAFSRVPVFEGTQDRIIGMLHTRDLLVATAIKRPINLRQLLREALFVPDTQRADELLKQLRAKREHLAIVLDEYGGTAGLVTMTDLVSRIVGDIDEPGQGEPDILHTADGGAQLNGLTSIGDLNEAFDLDVKDDNYDTIGGLIMGRLDRIPKVGDMVELKAGSNVLALTVEEMDRLRVAKVRLTRRIEA